MRIEQIIAAVARPVAVAIVREIQAVVSFACDTCLHLWLQRMPLGMPAYACVPSSTSTFSGNAGGIKRDIGGRHVGGLCWRLNGVTAFRPLGCEQA